MENPIASVLLVADQTTASARELARLGADFHIQEAREADAVLQSLRQPSPPDLVILDPLLPGWDGFALLGSLTADPLCAGVGVILLLPWGAEAEETRGLALGAVDCIHCPISPQRLLVRLQAQLALRRSQRLMGEQNRILEDRVSAHNRALQVAQEKLERLVSLGIALSAEKDSAKVMDMILTGAKDLTNADGGSLYLRVGSSLHFQIVHNRSLNIHFNAGTTGGSIMPEVPLFDPLTGEPNHRNVVTHALHCQTTINIVDAYDTENFDFSGTRRFDAFNGYRSKSFLTVPLMPRGGEVIGVLQLINAQDEQGEVVPFDAGIQRYVEALAAQAATALYNRELLDAQERLLDALIRIVAGSIDAKSPYTGAHCARVPELAVMLAQAASNQNEGPLARFRFTSSEEWREFHIGAWLHDCGKVTTPEHVVDKATKLEMVYNRIHEVRMRFEVLLRDAQIAQLSALMAGADPQSVQRRFEETRDRLFDDFAFVAECNVGGESMESHRIRRLQEIARIPWQRYFDNRLGLSHGELRHLERLPHPTTPTTEFLLMNRPEHRIPRDITDQGLDPALGFNLKVPTDLYNHGEVYNLSVSRGTLTEEERYKINEHIIQTIVMLERMPFPKHLSRIPEYAGAHHETMSGSGYPRGLSGDNLSVPARIMVIADIFEALTASDRPYKKAKPLSEAVKILYGFKREGHIDPDLFDLFLTCGIYRDYAQKHLKPEQIDAVDIRLYLGDPRGGMT
ncbi:MAG: GAF domain-containing protein [Magnetococcus sp. WYHC-3]